MKYKVWYNPFTWHLQSYAEYMLAKVLLNRHLFNSVDNVKWGIDEGIGDETIYAYYDDDKNLILDKKPPVERSVDERLSKIVNNYYLKSDNYAPDIYTKGL